MKTENLTLEKALEQGKQLPFALIRQYSAVSFGKTPKTVDAEELLEARFFDQNKEIRIFRRDDALCAVSLVWEPGDRKMWASYSIENGKLGKSFSVCHLLNCDEDGQSYIEETCLTGWEGVVEHGQ